MTCVPICKYVVCVCGLWIIANCAILFQEELPIQSNIFAKRKGDGQGFGNYINMAIQLKILSRICDSIYILILERKWSISGQDPKLRFLCQQGGA